MNSNSIVNKTLLLSPGDKYYKVKYALYVWSSWKIVINTAVVEVVIDLN
jgi:hypothetical protein